jgi:hypothetical protein
LKERVAKLSFSECIIPSLGVPKARQRASLYPTEAVGELNSSA